jgi:RNA polymerase sigma factor (sigma-70 family)
MADSDASLVARVVRDDDRVAFELLVRRYQSPLRNFLRRLTRADVDRADDLAQETFMKLYTSIATYRGSAKFSTWLYRIAYNTFLNDQRRVSPDTAFDESFHAPVADTADAAGDQTDVERALRELGDRERAVFDLHYRKGMTHHEVANVLEVPLGTVKSDLTRGREKLKSILEDWEQGRDGTH